MRALSLTPPWHVAILRHGKRIENRDWRGCDYRGPILLHASKSVGTRAAFDETVDSILTIVNPPPGVGPGSRHEVSQGMAEMRIGGRGMHHAEGWWAPHPDLARGAIVGRCRIAGVIRDARDLAAYQANVPRAAGQGKWWMGGFALVLADVERIVTPIPLKGALGFFKVPETLLMGSDWEAVPM